MNEELTFAVIDGHEFTTNLWCSINGEEPTKVRYTLSEIDWAVSASAAYVMYFVWDGVDPDTKFDWDIDANLPTYTRDWLRYVVAGYRIGGVIYHKDDVEVIRAGANPIPRLES